MQAYRFFKPGLGKEVEVYWVGSFWKTRTNKWNVNVYLFDGMQIIQGYLPIGAMPFLAIGAKVDDGYLRGSMASEDNGELRINNLAQGNLINFGQLPRNLCSYYGNQHLSREKVYSYVCDNKTYFIPQSEIVRAFLTTNTTFANSIIAPEGLSFLISSYNIVGDKLNVELSKEYPKQLLTHGNVIHLMSVYLKGSLNDLWWSVFRNALTDSSAKKMFDIVPMKGVKLQFKYKQFMNFVLVKEIRDISGLRPPFNSLSYTHPAAVEKSGDKEEEKRRIPKGNKDHRNLDHTTSPGFDSNRDAVWHDSIHIKMHFRGIKAEHVMKQSDNPRKHIKNVSTSTKISKYTLRNYIGDGKGKPIELQNLSVLPEDINIAGLEKFLRAVAYIEKHTSARVHNATVVPLAGESAFVRVGESPRNCAVIFVEESVILEFGRPDNYPISTLIINKYDSSIIEDDIGKLIASVIENNGHWDASFLSAFHSFSYKFAKHSRNDTPENWGSRLLQKMWI
ncbi:hypothetical protein Dacet_0249 [Denitrovibrio acetiphilus DSM 12809]|uniref:TnsE C-terminal domain-containing protein n=1 Tax=Denitrovibrio acetiphilus (strain DSM 12809 / NBRC 114555 / N2460) TaxID=522772 RepID=D4H2J0_DENA2|nr:hypothetical protein [Denitrovibrio acetiphilus]ADD67051.1 hypothetical protein Dacet_0249 [Denitrovibrio acetiphilus DSM 12809]